MKIIKNNTITEKIIDFLKRYNNGIKFTLYGFLFNEESDVMQNLILNKIILKKQNLIKGNYCLIRVDDKLLLTTVFEGDICTKDIKVNSFNDLIKIINEDSYNNKN